MKRLMDLLSGEDTFQTWGNLNLPVSGISYDSRKVKKGDVYVAIRGFRRDGIEFLPEAVENGAVAVVSIHPPDTKYSQLTWVQVKNDRRILSHLASRFYKNPSQRLQMIGVTGTNGKTTTTLLIDSILNKSSRAAWIGTLGMNFGGEKLYTSLTTPEAPDLFRFLDDVERQGCRYVVMEVSSAALELLRVEDIRFSQAIFTSFSGEHLDFHHTLENYLEAKLSLFRKLSSESWAVINADDAMAGQVSRELKCPYLTYGFRETADIRPLESILTLRGVKAVLMTPKGAIDIDSSMVGRFNLSNIMGAIASALLAGVDISSIQEGIRSHTPVKGRAQPVYRGEFQIFVDYAHTDDALRNLLESFRGIVKHGRIILVFGAGGNKDVTKRPRMGAVAAELADLAIVTSDNPRDEDPKEIIRQIMAGMPPRSVNAVQEPDREKAIIQALSLAEPGDVVLIAGKGHEVTQVIKGKEYPFSDEEVVSKWLGRENA